MRIILATRRTLNRREDRLSHFLKMMHSMEDDILNSRIQGSVHSFAKLMQVLGITIQAGRSGSPILLKDELGRSIDYLNCKLPLLKKYVHHWVTTTIFQTLGERATWDREENLERPNGVPQRLRGHAEVRRHARHLETLHQY